MSMREMTVRPPSNLVEVVEREVRSGSYESASAMVPEGLRAIADADEGLEAWLRDEVVASCREMERFPERAIPIDDVRAFRAGP